MKVPITQLDFPALNLIDPCRVSVGKGRNGHALYMKVNNKNLTVFTDTESLTRLRDELTKYLENPQ